MNDDLVQPHTGFGTHPHRNMEIITYIVHGQLTHQDSMGTKESLGRGSCQFMTAGTGIRHSEDNEGDVPLRFIQTWVVPEGLHLTPNYGSYNGEEGKEERKNKLQHLVSSAMVPCAPVQVNQDIDGYASEMDLGQKISYELDAQRQAYLLCIEGSVTINGKKLEKHDACEIIGGDDEPTQLEIEAKSTEQTESGDVAHIFMYCMRKEPGSGRRDL